MVKHLDDESLLHSCVSEAADHRWRSEALPWEQTNSAISRTPEQILTKPFLQNCLNFKENKKKYAPGFRALLSQ